MERVWEGVEWRECGRLKGEGWTECGRVKR